VSDGDQNELRTFLDSLAKDLSKKIMKTVLIISIVSSFGCKIFDGLTPAELSQLLKIFLQ